MGEKMSNHSVVAPATAPDCWGDCRAQEERAGAEQTVLSDHREEAGLDPFWINRMLEKEGIEFTWSRPRLRVRADTAAQRPTRIDGEAPVRALLAYKRGDPRVSAMLRVPAPEEKDRRRIMRAQRS
ncbi:hypothetical protein CK220_10820 [Mesorhizobium sp. WSM3860]|nr:hypothetical protein CK220_10820 [Mesorhizobium sp. WSM3860]